MLKTYFSRRTPLLCIYKYTLNDIPRARFASQEFFNDQFKEDLYAKLDLKSGATNDEIKKRFYELAKTHHPDTEKSTPGDEEKFKQIAAAYDVLSNTEMRHKYD
mgnify:CR=1 FL=1